VGPARQQGGTRQHGQQDQKDLKFGFHDGPNSQGNRGRSMRYRDACSAGNLSRRRSNAEPVPAGVQA
jgi:hypothetical protein